MKNETTVKTKDPVTGKYAKADNCFVAFAKLTAVGVGLVIAANVLSPKPTPVTSTPAPQMEITHPEVNPEAERLAQLEREAAEAFDRVNNPAANCSAVFKTCW